VSVSQSIWTGRESSLIGPSGPGSSESWSSEEERQSDMSEGRGGDDGASTGKVLGVCIEVEKDFAGAKSSSVKMVGLKG
jgi:hypothetical protein